MTVLSLGSALSFVSVTTSTRPAFFFCPVDLRVASCRTQRCDRSAIHSARVARDRTSCVSQMATEEDSQAQEDELLALESIYDERVFQRRSGERGGQMCVSVDVSCGICVQIQAEGSAVGEQAMTENALTVRHLPPVMLSFQFPDDYPSKSPPVYSLSCKWLSRSQVSANQARLIEYHWPVVGWMFVHRSSYDCWEGIFANGLCAYYAKGIVQCAQVAQTDLRRPAIPQHFACAGLLSNNL